MLLGWLTVETQMEGDSWSWSEKFIDCHAERGEKGLGQDLASGEDGDELEAVGGAVIDFQIIVARIDHPESGDTQIFIEGFFENGIGVMITGVNDFGGEPEFVGGGGSEGQVGAN
jgi:hypothetical protein